MIRMPIAPAAILALGLAGALAACSGYPRDTGSGQDAQTGKQVEMYEDDGEGFADLDTDDSGDIDRGEWTEAGMSDDEMLAMDSDGDGVVDADEWSGPGR